MIGPNAFPTISVPKRWTMNKTKIITKVIMTITFWLLPNRSKTAEFLASLQSQSLPSQQGSIPHLLVRQLLRSLQEWSNISHLFGQVCRVRKFHLHHGYLHSMQSRHIWLLSVESMSKNQWDWSDNKIRIDSWQSAIIFNNRFHNVKRTCPDVSVDDSHRYKQASHWYLFGIVRCCHVFPSFLVIWISFR